MAASIVKKIPIGALQPSSKDCVLVALIIGKTEPRRVMLKDGSERFVSSFTLRDSPTDIINFVVWSSRDKIDEFESYPIGSVVEVCKPRIINRDFGSDREKFSPCTTSPFQLSSTEGKTTITLHLGDNGKYEVLKRLPTKASAGYFTINDVAESKKLAGRFVDLCAAVRSVGPIKEFQGAGGDQRRVRDVRLFDAAASSIVMKVWDNNLIQMSETWMPRETVLFIADLKVSYDDWRGCNTVSCTGRTIITENPDICEAALLHRRCQQADFSSLSRMDSLLTNINLASISQVHNVFSLTEELQDKVCQDKEDVLFTNIYGYITKFDIDLEQSVVLRCGCCAGPYKADEASQALSCVNIDCKMYRIDGPNRQAVHQFDVKADISDETGTILACRVRPEVLERAFGVNAQEFTELSDVGRTSFKWTLFLVPLKICLGILLPSQDRRQPFISIVHLGHVSMEQLCANVPTPVTQ